MEVEPIWNRLLLFWSDDRSPHEVLSACRDRTYGSRGAWALAAALWVGLVAVKQEVPML